MMSNKSRRKVDLRALHAPPIITQKIMDPMPTILISSTSMPCRSGSYTTKSIHVLERDFRGHCKGT